MSFAESGRRTAALACGLAVVLLAGCWGNPPNQPPIAQFQVSAEETYPFVEVTFDASGSVDPDGQIVEYRWDLGDGTESTGVVVQHSFASPGTYTVRLTVRDDKGASAMAEKMITVLSPSPGNQPPVARFTFSPASPRVGEPVTFDASESTDPAGIGPRAVASYRWEFGDGNHGSGRVVRHTYTRAGTYPVRLTVRDEQGLAGTAERVVTVRAVEPGPNQPPVARFSYSPANPTAGTPVSFDARASSDPDGTIVSYAWDFGGGNQGSGVEVRHTFYAPGTHTVRLTVTDDRGATASAEERVTVGPPVPPPPPG